MVGSSLIFVSYVIGIVLSGIGVMMFGAMIGWITDRVVHHNGSSGTDEDAVDQRFYGKHYGNEEDY